jgi:hypothetical protein
LMVMSPLRPVGWEFKNRQLVIALRLQARTPH